MASSADTALLRPETVFFDIEAVDRDDLFRKLGERLAPLGYIKDNWLEAITTRERSYPTGLQTSTIGIAIPHADNCVERPYIAIVKPREPVVFEAMAGMGDPLPASLVINLGIVRDGGQVEVLQSLMNIFMSDDAVADIMAQTTPDGMVESIKKCFG